MTPAPKRRWFRWSLRTMFVVVTAFVCWLGYELNWIRERHEFLVREESATTEQIWTRWQYEPKFARALHNASHARSAPGLLWLFGERGQKLVTIIVEWQTVPHRAFVLNADSQSCVAEAKRLFPESNIATFVMPKEKDEAPWLGFDYRLPRSILPVGASP